MCEHCHDAVLGGCQRQGLRGHDGGVRDGADPWAGTPVHAYGPLFNLFAVVTPLSWLAPKELFVFGHVLALSWLTLVIAALWLGEPMSWRLVAGVGLMTAGALLTIV